jgi:hypothetical protein
MRKLLLLVLASAVVIFASAGAGSTGAANVNAPVFAVGGGSIGVPGSGLTDRFNFSAQTGPTGDFGHSSLTLIRPDGSVDADVTVDCVNVFPVPGFDGAAWFAGAVTRVTPQPNAFGITLGTRLAFYVVDASGTAPDDYEPFFESVSCKTLGFNGYDPVVTNGNITVSTG